MFVDYVRSLHNQIQTNYKKCSQLKKNIYKFTILSLSNGKRFKTVLLHNRWQVAEEIGNISLT